MVTVRCWLLMYRYLLLLSSFSRHCHCLLAGGAPAAPPAPPPPPRTAACSLHPAFISQHHGWGGGGSQEWGVHGTAVRVSSPCSLWAPSIAA